MEEALNENAAVLARMAEQGDDLTQAREIEFAYVFDNSGAAEAFCAWATQRGFAVAIETRDDSDMDVIVRRQMVPDLHLLTDLELALAAAARDHAGEPDGWGCLAVPIPRS